MRKTIILILCFILFLSGCKRSDSIGERVPISKDGFYFDTIITVSIYGMEKKDADLILDKCFSLAQTFENALSNTLESSEVSSINKNAPNPVSVSAETIEVIKSGLHFGDISNGEFDITMGNVISLWDFVDGIIPDSTLLQAEADKVDYKKIKISENTVSLAEPNVSIDLGGIAKGFIADKMKELLLSEGVESAIINLGGNVLVLGSHTDGTPFKVGIQDPFSDAGESFFILPATDTSIVTSGNYQRFFEKDGIRYHHILDKHTGMPVDNGISSVTIIGDKSTDCDALSTIAFILGPDKGLNLIESIEGFECIYIKNSGEIIKSSGVNDLELK